MGAKIRAGRRKTSQRSAPSGPVGSVKARHSALWAAVALVLLAGGAVWGATFLTARAARSAVLAGVPELPDLSRKPVALRQALTEANEALRHAAGRDDEIGIGRAAGRLGRLYQANSYGDHAAQSYQVAMERDTDNPRWPYYLAVLRQEKGETAAVTPLLRRTVEFAPEYSPAWLRLGDNQFKQEQRGPARQSYERRLTLSPGDPHAHLGLARIDLAASRWEAAEGHLQEAVETDPSFDPAHRLLASIHEHFGRRQQMTAALERADAASRFAPALDPWVDGLLDECFDLDWLLFQVSRYAYADGGRIAQTLFDRALELDRDNPDVYLVFGQYARSPAEARQAYETAIALDPANAGAHALLGEALLNGNRPAEADPVLRKAIALDANMASPYRNLGLAAAMAGRFDEAITYVEQALVRQPESVAAHYSLASILRAAGRTEEAVRQYRRLLTLKPSHPQAAAELEALLRTAGTRGPGS